MKVQSLLKAHGIPDRSNMGDLRSLPEKKDATFLIQEHKARKAGRHYDIRIGTPNTRLFSWATRKELPKPGEKPILLYQQPIHAYPYKDYEGEIRSRYGAGTVRKHEEGKALILDKSPDKLKFVLTHRGDPESFTLLKTRDPAKSSWLLFNTTPSKPLEYEKEKYKLVRPNEVKKLITDPDYVMTPKLDGAAVLVKLLKNKADVYSYRTSVDNRPIVHSHRVGGLDDLDIPKDLRGSLLRGELWASKGDKAIPPQQLSGLLNSSVDKSLAKQRAENIKMHVALFGKVPEGKKTPFDLPEEQRQAIVKKVLAHLPKDKFHMVPVAKTEKEKQELWDKIRKGEHPLTQEGIVAHRLEGGQPIKSKLMKEHDVYIRGVFEGEGKYKGNSAGGFEYSYTPFGPVVGKVGMGISDEVRKEMWENKGKYIGRVAKLTAQDKFPSGALRVPIYLGLHEDMPHKKAEFSLLKSAKVPGFGPTGYIAPADILKKDYPNYQDVSQQAGSYATQRHLPNPGTTIEKPVPYFQNLQSSAGVNVGPLNQPFYANPGMVEKMQQVLQPKNVPLGLPASDKKTISDFRNFLPKLAPYNTTGFINLKPVTAQDIPQSAVATEGLGQAQVPSNEILKTHEVGHAQTAPLVPEFESRLRPMAVQQGVIPANQKEFGYPFKPYMFNPPEALTAMREMQGTLGAKRLTSPEQVIPHLMGKLGLPEKWPTFPSLLKRFQFIQPEQQAVAQRQAEATQARDFINRATARDVPATSLNRFLVNLATHYDTPAEKPSQVGAFSSSLFTDRNKTMDPQAYLGVLKDFVPAIM